MLIKLPKIEILHTNNHQISNNNSFKIPQILSPTNPPPIPGQNF